LQTGSIYNFFLRPIIRIPIGIVYLVGNKNHFAEIGAGAYYTHYRDYNVGVNFIVPYGSLGYRYQFTQIPVFFSFKCVVFPDQYIVLALGFKF